MNSGFWMAKGTGSFTDSETNYDNASRLEPKRAHHWFMDGHEADLLPNKKQAVGSSHNNLFTGMLNSNNSSWGNASNIHSFSGHFTERLFDTEAARAVNYDDRSIPSVNTGKMDLVRKDCDDPFGNDSLFGLSVTRTIEDPSLGLNYGGIRKVKVSQVKDSESMMAVGHSYDRSGNNNTLSIAHDYDITVDNSLSMAHSYIKEDSNTLLAADGYHKTDGNSIPMGVSCNKGDDTTVSIGDTCDRDGTNFISMSQPYIKGDENICLDQTYKENNNIISMGHAFSKSANYIMCVDQRYSKEDESTISMDHIYGRVDDSSISLDNTYVKGDNSNLSMGHSYNKNDSSTIISFGGYNDDDDTNPSGRLIYNYDMFMSHQQPSNRRSEPVDYDMSKLSADAVMNSSQIAVPAVEIASRKKDDKKVSKKAPSNSFPSNVRSLLSTGMLDGVPVKYIAWSREKELRAVIKGSGYLCGCPQCNASKVINAYEFERHAGCKTKHPNNHIYFENGKTIYGIVLELRSTPQNMLFDVIQTITGSPIDQKSFRLWKESFLAATRELQRIYGNYDAKQL